MTAPTLLGAGVGTGRSITWRSPVDVAPSCHALSRDGERALIGAIDGRVLLIDRRGNEIWRYSLGDRVESVLCCEDSGLFLAGTWGGEVSACVDQGLLWTKDLGGVVGALAGTGGGERIAAASWANQLAVYRRDGTPTISLALADAVVALVVHSTETPVYAVLADHTLVALDSGGVERWRRGLDSRPRYLAVANYDLLVATDSGTLLWLNDEGSELRRREVTGGIQHVAASRDGAWIAWLDRLGRLSFWQPDRDQGFKDVVLPEPADTLSVTGQGDGAFCSVALADARMITFNRYRRELVTQLPDRIRNTSFSGSGTSATMMSHDGSAVFYVELLAVKDWQPPPKVGVRLSYSELSRGNLGTVTLDLSNEEGCRTAYKVEATIASEFLAQQPRIDQIAAIRSGETLRVIKSVEPMRAGRLPISITLSYEDELHKRFEDTREEFVKVG
jgi:hypothetical protein